MCKQVVPGIYIAAMRMMRIVNVLQFIKLNRWTERNTLEQSIVVSRHSFKTWTNLILSNVTYMLVLTRLAVIDGDGGYTSVKPQHRCVTCPPQHRPPPSFRFFFIVIQIILFS